MTTNNKQAFGRGRPRMQVPQSIVDRALAGESYTTLSRETGISHTTIRNRTLEACEGQRPRSPRCHASPLSPEKEEMKEMLLQALRDSGGKHMVSPVLRPAISYFRQPVLKPSLLVRAVASMRRWFIDN